MSLDASFGGNSGWYGLSREIGSDISFKLWSSQITGIYTLVSVGLQILAMNSYYEETITDPTIRDQAIVLETINIAAGFAGAWAGAKIGAKVGLYISGENPIGGIIGGAIDYYIANEFYDMGVDYYYR